MTIEEALEKQIEKEKKEHINLLKKAFKMSETKQKRILKKIQECAEGNDNENFSTLLMGELRKMNEIERVYAVHALEVLKGEKNEK